MLFAGHQRWQEGVSANPGTPLIIPSIGLEHDLRPSQFITNLNVEVETVAAADRKHNDKIFHLLFLPLCE